MEPRIIAQTPRWLVLDKPAGWLTIPGRDPSDQAPVVVDWAKRQVNAGALVVHRLDRETSGVLLMALTPEAHREAGLWFQRHEVRKAYDCLASGAPRLPVFRCDGEVGGQPSRTQIEVKERFAGAFLARAVPLTGRRHQIRVHLSQARHPILGDTAYGGDSSLASRVALHARSLELPTRESWQSDWPADFAGWVEALRKTASGN